MSKLVAFPILDGGFSPVGVRWRKDEHCEQVALIQWAAWMSFRASRGEADLIFKKLDWLFAIPNGGDRDKIVAGRMKAEGVKSGVSDLFLPVARGGYFGLWIEMKRHDGGEVLANQTKFLEFVGKEGYANVICHGVEIAIHSLKRYLALKPTKRGETHD